MTAAEWVKNAYSRELSEFQARAVNLLCRAMGCGPYDLGSTFEKADWQYGYGVRFTVYAKCGFSTFDGSKLTTLVIGAHEEAIRVEIEPCNPSYLRVCMWQRQRDGEISQRHPTIEQAVETYRGRA